MDNNDGSIRGGLQWTHLGLQEFRVYITICLFKKVKKLPSTILYWSRNKPLYHCPIILQSIIRDTYELIARCLYVISAPWHVVNHKSATYNKLYKVRWMVQWWMKSKIVSKLCGPTTNKWQWMKAWSCIMENIVLCDNAYPKNWFILALRYEWPF